MTEHQDQSGDGEAGQDDVLDDGYADLRPGSDPDTDHGDDQHGA